MPVDFAYHLVNRRRSEIRAWCSTSDLNDPSIWNIVIPLKDSRSVHFGLAVIRRDVARIDIIDFRSATRTFVPLLPALYRAAHSLRPPWPSRFEYIERRDAQFALSSHEFAPLVMCFHAFLVSVNHTGSFVPTMSPQTLRQAVVRCMVTRTLNHLRELLPVDVGNVLDCMPSSPPDSPPLLNFGTEGPPPLLPNVDCQPPISPSQCPPSDSPLETNGATPAPSARTAQHGSPQASPRQPAYSTE